MANPRYPMPPQRGNKDSELIAQLAALSQIQSSMQRPEMEAQAQKQQMALGLLGLLNQMQNQQGIRADNKAALDAQMMQFAGNQANRAAELGVQNANAQAEREARAKQQQDLISSQMLQFAGGQANRAAELGIQNTNAQLEREQKATLLKQEMDARLEQERLAQSRAVLMQLPNFPGMTPEAYLTTASTLGVPNADAAVQAGRDAVASGTAQQLQSVLGPVYQKFQTDPAKAQEALNMLWSAEPRMQSPAVLEKLQPWLDAQNAAVPMPQSTAPGVKTNGQVWLETAYKSMPGSPALIPTAAPIADHVKNLLSYLAQPAR